MLERAFRSLRRARLERGEFLRQRIAFRLGSSLRAERLARERFVAGLQRTPRAVFVFLRLVGGNVALALLRGHLRLNFDQRIFGLADALVELAHDLARVTRRVLHGVGRVVQETF